MSTENDPQGQGLPPGGGSFMHGNRQGDKHVLPPRTIQSPAKKRLKAFRVPMTYAVDAIIGYQGSADQFSIYRIKPGTIPEGFTVSFVTFDHTKQSAYIVLEHPSFPEYEPGTLCEEIEPIELEEIPVEQKVDRFEDWCKSHNFDPVKDTELLRAMFSASTVMKNK